MKCESMRPSLLSGMLLLLVAYTGVPSNASQHSDMTHRETALFVARLSGDQVVPSSKSNASGTGAFVLEVRGQEARLNYNLTFDGLQNGAAAAIRLRNFGPGANGRVVRVICETEGASNNPCPPGGGATLSGSWTSRDREPLTRELVRELAAQRIYLEVETGQSKRPEVRGQLLQQSFMAHSKSFVGDIRSGNQGGTNVTGTAAFDFVRIGDDRVVLLYDVTVTGISGTITAVSLAGQTSPQKSLVTIPINRRSRRTGTTVSGQADQSALPQLSSNDLKGMLADQSQLSIVISTTDRRAREIRANLAALR